MENISLLQKVSFFQDLTDQELEQIEAISETISFKLGQKVFEEGAESDAFYIVKSGSVMVKSKNIVLATLESGQPIGEMSFIDKLPRSATITSIDDTELVKVSSDALEALLNRETTMAAKVYKAIALSLSKRLRETGEAINTRFQPVKH